MSEHYKYRYSVTIKTDDLAVLHCLRALSQYAERTGLKFIAWGGTTERDWERDNNCVTFHFSDSEYRDSFIKEASRLLPKELWIKVKENDNDPASPQSTR